MDQDFFHDQVFFRVFDDEKTLQKSFKIEAYGNENSTIQKYLKTKNIWNFRKNAPKIKIEKLHHVLFKNSKKQFFVCQKACLKN